jgi:hypothetical protein
MKPIYLFLPLIYFIMVCLFWVTENYMTTGVINYIALGAAALLFAQLFVRNKIAGLVTGVVMAVFSGYMLVTILAGAMGANGISSGNAMFVLFASAFFGVGIVMAVLFIMYHAKMARI